MKVHPIQSNEGQSKSDERLRNSIIRHPKKFTIQPLYTFYLQCVRPAGHCRIESFG